MLIGMGPREIVQFEAPVYFLAGRRFCCSNLVITGGHNSFDLRLGKSLK